MSNSGPVITQTQHPFTDQAAAELFLIGLGAGLLVLAGAGGLTTWRIWRRARRTA